MLLEQEKSARERIVDTALDLFYRQGYLATGINQIIAESQVAKATFYAHFPSKEALCVAYLQARHIIWMGWLRASVAKNASSREKLIGVFSFLKKWMVESDYRGCAFLNIASEVPSVETKIRQEVIDHKNELQKYLRQIIDELVQTDVSLTTAEARDMAGIIYVLVEGAIVSSQNYCDTWPIDSARKAAEKLLGI